MKKNLKLSLRLWLIPFIYAGTTLSGQVVTTQTFNYTGSIQNFTVPACVSQVTIDARGAQGGGLGSGGGLGARMVGTHSVVPGQVLSIVVPSMGLLQVGGNTQNSSGGGGGAFVFIAGPSPTLYVAAGGGGGLCNYTGSPAITPALDGTVGPNGNSSNGAGGIGGQGGAAGLWSGNPCSGGGAGWLSNGGGAYGGIGYNTWTGGPGYCAGGGGGCGGVGGFGGGGGGGNLYGGGGGGGGYSGGGGGTDPTHGAGGGSFSNGINQNNTSGYQTGNGIVMISYSNGGSPVVNFSPSTPSLCSGSSLTITASGAAQYTWSPGGANTPSIVINPTVNTVYTVVAAAPGCTANGSATTNVIVNPVPVLTLTPSNSLICGIGSVSITGTGANNYTWSPGGANTTSIAASPSVSTIYTVVGTNSFACAATSTILINVDAIPAVSVTASPTILCSGATGNLMATGATAYTWNPGALSGASVAVSPTAATVYTAVGASSMGCLGSATIGVNVNAAPTVTASTNTSTICAGTSATITTGGSANTYSWNTGATTSVIVVSPTTTTIYTVTGTDNNSCTATATVIQVVSSCTSLKSNEAEIGSILIYPNPGNGVFNLTLSQGMEIIVFDAQGKECFREKFSAGNNVMNLSYLNAGLYLLRTPYAGPNNSIRLIKE